MRYWLFVMWFMVGCSVPVFSADEYIRVILPAHMQNGERVYSVPEDLPGVEFAPEETLLHDIPGTAFIFLLYDGLKFSGFLYGQYSTRQVGTSNDVEQDSQDAGVFTGADEDEAKLTPQEITSPTRRPWFAFTSSLRSRARDTALASFERYAANWHLNAGLREDLRTALFRIADDRTLTTKVAVERLMTAWAVFESAPCVARHLNLTAIPLHALGNSQRIHLVEDAVARMLGDFLRFLNSGNWAFAPELGSRLPIDSLPAELRKYASEAVKHFRRGFTLQELAAQATQAAASKRRAEERKCSAAVLEPSKKTIEQLRVRTR